MTRDLRRDVLEVARIEAAFRDEDRDGKRGDPIAVLAGIASAINIAVDWLSEGDDATRADACELLNFCLDDIEDLISEPLGTQRGRTSHGAASESQPPPRSRTHAKSTDPPG